MGKSSVEHRWTQVELALLQALSSGECLNTAEVWREFNRRTGLNLSNASVINRLNRLGLTAAKIQGAYRLQRRPGNEPAPMPPPPDPEQETELQILRRKLETLTADLRQAEKDNLTDEMVKREIIGLAGGAPVIPDWVLRPPSGSDGFAGAPTLAFSDAHCNEVVDPAQVEGFNEYNLDIFDSRMQRLTEGTIELLNEHVRHNRAYPGLCIFDLGDGLSGEIHQELERTNEEDPGPAFLRYLGARQHQIDLFAAEFGRVFIASVPGNHGRLDEKPNAKGAAHRNWDWLAARLLQKHFEGDARVQFFVPDGTDALVRIYGHRYLLTHGNQFRGGDGIIGPLGPITRGDNRKRARNVALGSEYDTLVLGHFHRLMLLRNLIVNGSVKGLDEYAYQGNFPPEPPMQALWLTHPERGITISMPVFLSEKKPAAERDWVSWSAGAA